jgi:L,D-peptidoglycan transpeptidase YkuD (ErfK/YbiS/YcfS/YnhG family)
VRVGQVLSCLIVTAALVAGLLLVAHLGHAGGRSPIADATPQPLPSSLQPPAATTPGGRKPVIRAAPSASASPTGTPRRTHAPVPTAPGSAPATVVPGRSSASPRAARAATGAAPSARPPSRRAHRSAVSSAPGPRPPRTAPAERRGGFLPLPFSTGSATEVLTVLAPSSGTTTATLQAWQRAAGGGWQRHGSAIAAHVGADGLSRYPSESRSATPIGSFTLTQAFGREPDPGTALPYLRTTPADWWISQSGPLYNTHRRCSSRCAFTQGAPNEHLYYETPFYDYAVVIDYNTRNAPGGVRQGGGSAFFLHVTDGAPTAGCVAIPRDQLLSIMRWLSPGSHPRILIGTGS